jgi:uncharacterized membrane protein YdjX (TVP38/TMEM64 family)
MERNKKLKAGVYIFLIAVFAAAVVYGTIKLGPYITRMASTPDQLREVLKGYGWKSVPVFILLQMAQVIIAAIPGEVVQIAGGYVFGIWLGTLYSLTGIVAGSVIVFFVARLLGYSLVKIFVSQKNLEKFDFMMNGSKSEIIMFILFLIPGIPKDILTYIAGLTPIKPLKFFIIITVARFPALLASSVIGANIQERNYTVAIIISVIAVVLFIAGVLLKDKIIDRMHKIMHKAE